jgi:hypothetical protein
VSATPQVWYKATRPDGTSFPDGLFRSPATGVLRISDAPGEALAAGSWPARLFRVEPQAEPIPIGKHQFSVTEAKVLRELPAWHALGPNGYRVAALIERCKTITLSESQRAAYLLDLVEGSARDVEWSNGRYAARWIAWRTARDVARANARGAAWAAAREAAERFAGRLANRSKAMSPARSIARSAAEALVVRDVIDSDTFDLLYDPWVSIMDPVVPATMAVPARATGASPPARRQS